MSDHEQVEAGMALHQYWHDPDVPPAVREMADSFCDLNPDLRHRVFSRLDAESLIAEHFTDREMAAFRACAVPAMQADYFRYCAVLALGGIYADIGFRCRHPLRCMIEAADAGTLFKRPDTGTVINGLFLFKKPGHPLLDLALSVATLNIERRIEEPVSAVTGPVIFNILLELHRPGSLPAAAWRLASNLSPDLVMSFRLALGERGCPPEAFEGVGIESLDIAARWIERRATPLAHKESKEDWAKWHRRGETIFR